MRRLATASLLVCTALVSYVTSYWLLVERHSGRARGAGEYFHYRDCGYTWEVYVFVPVAFCEAKLIQAYPKAFLSTPSWSVIPQRLIIRLPDNTTAFSFPPWPKETPTGLTRRCSEGLPVPACGCNVYSTKSRGVLGDI